MRPTDVEHIRRSIANLVLGMTQLINEVDDAVFHIQFRQAKDEGRNGVQEIGLGLRQAGHTPNTMIDSF